MTSPEFIYTKIVHKFIIREGGSQSNIVALFHAQGGSQKSHEWLSCEILFKKLAGMASTESVPYYDLSKLYLPHKRKKVLLNLHNNPEGLHLYFL